MIPEGQFIEKEIVLRKLEKSDGEVQTRNSMIRKVVLSLGLVNPKESRTLVFDIFDILLSLSNENLSISDIHSRLKDANKDVSIKSVYYHIERMRAKGIVEKIRGNYRLLGGKNFGVEIKDKYEKEASEVLIDVENLLHKLMHDY